LNATSLWGAKTRIRVLRQYAAYYNTHRPHRALDQQPPFPKMGPVPPTDHDWRVRRRDRLGGLLHELRTRCVATRRDFRIRSPLVSGSTRLKQMRAVASHDLIDLPGAERIPQSRLSKTEPAGVEANRVSGTHTVASCWSRGSADMWSASRPTRSSSTTP
jgi:hypothetical protein